MIDKKFQIKKLFKDGIIFAVWLVVITFPLMVIKVNTIKDTVEWRWLNALWVLLSGYAGYIVWMYALHRKELGKESKKKNKLKDFTDNISSRINSNKKLKLTYYSIFGVIICVLPFMFKLYSINIMINVLIYVLLGLGLNIVVGLGGILNLGHAAFFAVGAYSYALLNFHFGLDFWIALPVGGLLAVVFGIILSVPVLRLKGDYLAIVTLAFGEIVRIVLENWDDLSFGPSGIANIPKPYIPFIKLSYTQTMQFTYYLMIVLTILAVIMSNRLKYSRIGRALIAMREDETASNTMGVNTTKMKIISFALGAFWAGVAGVMFAAKQAYINPVSFTIWNSIIVLCIVVLGGMGSIKGVIVAAFILTVLPEAFRTFQDYRMVLFGAVLVVMMVFKPEGLLPEKRKIYRLENSNNAIKENGE
jgi:branched-chain amino acid transport system permease protein